MYNDVRTESVMCLVSCDVRSQVSL